MNAHKMADTETAGGGAWGRVEGSKLFPDGATRKNFLKRRSDLLGFCYCATSADHLSPAV